MNRLAGPGNTIEIVGATANNLKNLDVQIPRTAATLVIGPSGSGKSSLLANTLAVEANARMKRFLGVAQDHLEASEVAAFVGPLPACVHFAQGAFRASQRTTVSTASGLLSVLRRLFLKFSVPWAESQDEPVPPPSAATYAAWLRRHYRGRITVSAIPLRFVASNGVDAARRLRSLGFERATLRSETDPPKVWETGRIVELDRFNPLSPERRHILEVEVGLLHLPDRSGSALAAILDRAFDAGRGSVVVELHDAGPELAELRGPRGTLLDSNLHHVHPAFATVFAPPSEPLLSFNMPGNERSGACRECLGTGQALSVPETALVNRADLSLHAGALSLWTEKNYKHVNIQHETVEGLRGLHGFDPDVPWAKLSTSARRLILEGSHGVGVEDRDRRTGRRLSPPRPFEGFVPAILRRFSTGSSASERLSHLVSRGPCPSCSGTRWSPQARALRVGDLGIADLLAADFAELGRMTEPDGSFARQVPPEASTQVSLLHHMARSFVQVGLGHLSGDRGMLTLSEGEARRVRLAGLLEARGRGLGLLLDEPARGLHEQDIAELVESLRRLKRHHTVILNDHRLSLARAVDLVIELGPGAGERGGRIVHSGPPAEVLRADDPPHIDRPRLPVPDRHPFLEIRGGTLHTLRDVNARIPLGRLVCITGVSGSGKSNFVRGVLMPALQAELGDKVDLEDFALRQQGSWKSLRGAGRIEAVLALDQRKPEANRRSLVATLLGVAESLRKEYAAQPEARSLGLQATDFGLNAGRGRCPDCLGLGEREEAGEWVPCSRCGGRRFGEEVLAVRMAGLNIAEALSTSIENLIDGRLSLGGGFPDLLRLLTDLDLGYVTLGRRVDQLSGGEVQRLRIAHRLWRRSAGSLFLVLDEPSAGLHPRDVERLLRVLDRIVEEGSNTVVLVEHNLDLIRASDWILDFGPGGGPAGGKLLGQGPPEAIQTLDTPTGRVLSHPSSLRGLTSHPRAEPRTGVPAPEPVDVARARRARSWLQLLLGHEVAIPPSSEGGEDGLEGLAVEVNAEGLTERRPHEIGSLDLEIARLFLAASPSPSSLEEEGERFVRAWREAPQARLLIQPLLSELQIWGSKIPSSVLKEAQARLESLGLRLEPSREKNPAAFRATGPRLLPEAATAESRQRALSDALALGAGYVELRDGKGRLLEALRTRCLDMDAAIVAPLAMTSVSLSRTHAAGACPACKGSGSLPHLNLDLLARNRGTSPDSEAFFTPEALAVLKGVRRGSMIPFFRRLAQEDLWDLRKPFDQLAAPEREILLDGYWRRPGPGSFLKARKADPQEVASWLRWDGLYRAVLDQLDRSPNAAWAEAVRRSLRAVECTVCRATGLAPHCRVVERDGRSLADWIRTGQVGELSKSLQSSACRTVREQRTRERVVYCLEPLARKRPELPLREPVGDPVLARAVYERVVESFTSLGIASPSPETRKNRGRT
jgi:excinuclease ABC A subunit